MSSSPFLLAKAGALKGKKFTVGVTKEDIERVGVFEKENYSKEFVVQDGNIITARGRGFIRFGQYFGNALNLKFDERSFQE
ncbi:DJ-1/PfpI family protein [Jeotgalibacillus marinus]|uniref:DJ-1/PfpI family protein n=1 Tax=Jeotgalibacillus marinus TaxID=86667 RepID=A0ABV3Q325_9BACL